MDIVYVSQVSTPIGLLNVAATEYHLLMLEYSDEKRLQKHFSTFDKEYQVIDGKTALVKQLEAELADYFDGNRVEFTIPIKLIGTEFQKSVWEQIRLIPFGTTRTYFEQATRMEQPLAIRAIANANGQNKLAIIVPCHRIIGSNGTMTGYSGGTGNKKYLLDLEQGVRQKKLF